MSTLTISTKPSKINWADDEEDDFDFETWKSTADTSAPDLSSLPPLQLPSSSPDTEPTYTSFTAGESAPWADSTSAPLPPPPPPPKIDWSNVDFRCAKPMLAWRAVEKAPGAPAYSEMGDCWGRRVGYSGMWAGMKAGSGWDCRGTVLFRGSKLRMGEVVEEDEADVKVVEEEVEEAGQQDVEQEMVVKMKDEEVVEHELVEVVDPELVEVIEQDDDELAQQVIEVEVKQELKIPVVDLALQEVVEQEKLEILPVDLAPNAPPEELEISSFEAIDLAPASTLPSDVDPSLADPIPLAINTKPTRDEGYYSDRSSSPPLSPPLTSVGLAPAATFAKPCRNHKRRDSQQALEDDGKSSSVSSDVNCDIEDTELDYGGAIVSLEDTEGIQDAASLGCKDAYPSAQISGASKRGWYHALSSSWINVALITAGVLAGGAMCFGRRRR